MLARRLACPACGAHITFAQAVGSAEFAFPCRGCSAKLCKKLRTGWLALAGLLLVGWIFSQYGFGWIAGLAFAGTTTAIWATSYLLGRVSLAPPEMMDGDLAAKLGLNRSRDGTTFNDGDGGGDGGGD
jgi:hypothetical protein